MRKKSINYLCVLALFCSCSSCAPLRNAAEKTPNTHDVIEFFLANYCGEVVARIHDAKSEKVKESLSRAYYRVLFVMWFGSANPRVSHIIDYDVSGYVRSFIGNAKSMGFEQFIDFDDPLNKKRLSDDVFNQTLEWVQFPRFYRWVLLQTKDHSIYEQDVVRFRAFIDRSMSQP